MHFIEMSYVLQFVVHSNQPLIVRKYELKLMHGDTHLMNTVKILKRYK